MTFKLYYSLLSDRRDRNVDKRFLAQQPRISILYDIITCLSAVMKRKNLRLVDCVTNPPSNKMNNQPHLKAQHLNI